MKRIIFTVINDLTYDRRMHKICTSLAENNYQVTLTGRKLHLSLPLESGLPYEQKRLKCFINKGKLFYIEYNIRLFFFLLFKKYDAACAIDLDTILPVLFSCILKKKKKLYDAHEFFTEVPELNGRNFTKYIWEITGKFSIPRIDLCYTVSESLAAIFKKKYGKNFDIIMNVPVLKEPALSKAQNEQYIIYQGAVNMGRGIETLIEAVRVIEIKVIICGNGDIYNDIINLIKKEKLGEKVILKGQVNPGELAGLTSNAWLGYNVLDPSSQSYYYSLSNKFFDYIHAGIPIITNDFPEYKKLNDKFEVAMFAGNNSSDIKKTILKLINDQNLYTKLKSNCQKAREVYNWQNEELKLLEIYRAV